MKVNLCHWAGCEQITNNYYCNKHKTLADKLKVQREQEHKQQLFKDTQRTTSRPYHHLYNCQRWRNLRKQFLNEHNTCVLCGGYANTVDHIYPHKGNIEMFYNMNNLQALCQSCHTKKTLKENNYFKKSVDR